MVKPLVGEPREADTLKEVRELHEFGAHVIERKRQLDEAINNAIMEFEHDTGLRVTEVYDSAPTFMDTRFSVVCCG